MGVAIPNASTRSWFQFIGITDELDSNLASTDYRKFTVSKNGEFNFKIADINTNVKIVDQNNKVVAEVKAKNEAAEVSAKLGPGTYTAVISQAVRGVNNREYTLDITERQNIMMVGSGAQMKGTARPVLGKDPGVQKHTLTVAQGGEFVANMSLPLARWALMSKEGKVVASGDTMKPEQSGQDMLKKSSFKIEPGQYELVIIPPKDVPGETPYQLNFVQKVAKSPDEAVERPFDKIMREREARLKQWAAEDATKSTGKAKTTPYKMSLLA
ncbi:hypothetical protein GBZ26_12900 [Azospirillum formosense]|uniref:DUF4198 domain-containing protein n=1 Tax=Azospirillum formosense TaxID=861533 RepID=A0ABX2KXP0_9PROT|nr:hypothetical protein [Azospirillum formosense]MBY3754187.1 hypothetical protein [Azospirillum formosense]NUB20107.1 hypothetical protein [Azospirillum formosense]